MVVIRLFVLIEALPIDQISFVYSSKLLDIATFLTRTIKLLNLQWLFTALQLQRLTERKIVLSTFYDLTILLFYFS